MGVIVFINFLVHSKGCIIRRKETDDYRMISASDQVWRNRIAQSSYSPHPSHRPQLEGSRHYQGLVPLASSCIQAPFLCEFRLHSYQPVIKQASSVAFLVFWIRQGAVEVLVLHT
jgi:hypothetical protein